MQVGRLFGCGDVTVNDFHRQGCVTERQKQCILQQKLSIDFPLTCGQLDARLNGIIQQVADDDHQINRSDLYSRKVIDLKTNINVVLFDMYPLYWTPSRGGIIMRYTYEYKRKCVELYREGKWPETPEGVSDKSFRDKVRLWVRAEDSRGPEALKHKNFNRNWTPEERLELVSQVMSGKSCVSVAIEAGIQDRLLYQWVQNYKTKGYNGLVEMKKGRPSKGVPQMKKEEARPLNESEREELIRLRAENEYIKAENEVIKKEIALREERHAAQLKARKQRSSKSCVKKDTN